MMSFIQNGGEITTWMEYCFKLKAQNPKQNL